PVAGPVDLPQSGAARQERPDLAPLAVADEDSPLRGKHAARGERSSARGQPAADLAAAVDGDQRTAIAFCYSGKVRAVGRDPQQLAAPVKGDSERVKALRQSRGCSA